MAETHSAVLTVVTCWCGMRHAVPSELYDHMERQHRDGHPQTCIYCPLGHQWKIAGEGRATQLERQLQRERASHDQTRAELRTKERQRRAIKGEVTKIKKRTSNGVCPCCHRTFKQLARHMESKHPEFVAEAKTEGPML